MNLNLKMPAPSGVVAGSTALFSIPVGTNLKGLALKFKYDAVNQNVSHFEQIRILLNGNVLQRYSGTDKDLMNQYDKLPSAANGYLFMPFSRNGVKTTNGEDITGINTASVDAQGNSILTMSMEIDLAAGVIITPTDLVLYAESSKRTSGGAGLLPYVSLDKRSIAAADVNYEISNLINPGVNNPQKIAIDRVHFIPSAGDLLGGNIRIRKNNETIFDRPDALNRAVQLSDNSKAPQAGVYTIDSRERGRGGDAIQLFGMIDFRYILGPSAAMQLKVYTEYFGKLS